MNYLFVVIYVAAVLFIRIQYEKYLELNGEAGSYQRKSLQDIVVETVVTGLLAGVGGSIVIVALGITIETEAVKYLFLSICLLALINLRYACISYSAGLVALVSLIFGYPRVDVPSLLGLAAVMQLAESLLIYFQGSRDSIPVFVKHGNELAGAFMIRKFWPVPIVFLTAIISGAQKTALFQFHWNSLFTPENLSTATAALGLDCVIAILCYTDLAISTQPHKKAKQMGQWFLGYSLLLLLIAIASFRLPWLRAVGAVFCMGAHEAIVLYGSHREKKQKPLFASVRRGLKVLEVLPGSHAEKMGLQGGDVILSINGKDIQTVEGVQEALREYPTFTWIDVASWDGILKSVEYKCYPGGYNSLGIISVPRERDVTYNTDYFEHLSIIKNIVNRFRDVSRSA